MIFKLRIVKVRFLGFNTKTRTRFNISVCCAGTLTPITGVSILGAWLARQADLGACFKRFGG